MSDYDYDDADYDRYDAERDAAHDRYESELRSILDPMVDAEVHKRVEDLIAADVQEIDEDAIREEVERALRPEAEAILSEMDPHDDYGRP